MAKQNLVQVLNTGTTWGPEADKINGNSDKANANFTEVYDLVDTAQDTADTGVAAAATADGKATTALSTANAAIPSAQKGAANGVASLDSAGKVPSAQLPSYVDDVLEFANLVAFPATGESGKIYVALDTNREYRWSGSTYIQLVASPGTTDNVPEGTTNLYFSMARVLATLMANLPAGSNTPLANGQRLDQMLANLQAQIQGAYVASDFTALTFGSTTNWNMGNIQNPQAKVTLTGNTTLNITNAKSGAFAILKVTVAAGVTSVITFGGAGLTFKNANQALTTYTLPTNAADRDYYIYFNFDGTAVNVVIDDYTTPANAVLPQAKATLGANQSIPTATFTAISFTVENSDNAAIFSLATPTRFVCPGTGPKLMKVNTNVRFTGSSAGTQRSIRIYINGASMVEYSEITLGMTANTLLKTTSFDVYLNGGDYIEVFVFQDSGAALNITGAWASVNVFSI